MTITIPTTPPRALLVSMAMRFRHDFMEDGARMTPNGYRLGGMTSSEREALLTQMSQIYEEVAGKGFYKWDEGDEQRGGLYDL